MSAIFTWSILAGLLLGVGDAHADSAAEQELLRLESVWNEAHTQGDPTALDGLWAEDLTVVVPRMAPMTKADGLAIMRSGRMKFLRYETSELSVRQFGHTALVAGRLTRSRQMGDRVLEDHWRFLKVYARGAAGWRVVAFQASDAAE